MNNTDSLELDEVLAQHGAEPGELTYSLKQAILPRYRSVSQIKEAVGEMEETNVNKVDNHERRIDGSIDDLWWTKRNSRNNLRKEILATLKVGGKS